jgi:hydroxyethylthiazole kinase-like sugar kinase family protein
MTTSQEIQKQALLLPIGDRWQLVQTLLESLKRESYTTMKRGNLSRLRSIAKNSAVMDEVDAKDDYINYLTVKHQ